jgi:hypothetical protein
MVTYVRRYTRRKIHYPLAPGLCRGIPWLKTLSNRLGIRELEKIGGEIRRQGRAAQITAYVETIFKANAGILKEAFKMSDVAMSLDQVLEESGLTAKWEARGEARGEAKGKSEKAIEVAQSLKALGIPIPQIAQGTGLSEEHVRRL